MGDDKKVNFTHYHKSNLKFIVLSNFVSDWFKFSLLQNTTESEHINLKVLGQDNAVVQFKIKKHTPLRKLMSAYCDRAVSTCLIL